MNCNKNHIYAGNIIAFRHHKNIVRRMKAAFILLFLGTSIALAGNTYSQESKLSFRLSETSIGQAISEIEKNSDYVFIWTDNIEVETNRKVSIEAKDEELESILDKILVGTTLSYRRFGKQVILYSDKSKRGETSVAAVSQQNKKRITGTVLDARGEAIIGANIIEKGTTNGIITDVDGKFSIETAYYLEAAPRDEGILTWGPPGQGGGGGLPNDVASVGYVSRIGGGRHNTEVILRPGRVPDSPAASACASATHGGRADWFLPSRDELHELFIQKNLFDNLSTVTPPTNYWTSNQFDDEFVYAENFNTGVKNTYQNNQFNVRAVRAF